MGLSGHQLLFDPLNDLTFKPTHSVGAQAYPHWEFPGPFQACDVLRRVKNDLRYLMF